MTAAEAAEVVAAVRAAALSRPAAGGRDRPDARPRRRPRTRRRRPRAPGSRSTPTRCRALMDPVFDKLVDSQKSAPSATMQAIGGKVTGAEAGALLAFMSSKVLGPVRPRPRRHARRCMLVAPNLVPGRARARRRPGRLPALGLHARGDPPRAVHRRARGCATTWSSGPARWPPTSCPTRSRLQETALPGGQAAARGAQERRRRPHRPDRPRPSSAPSSPRSPPSCRCSRATPTSSWTRSVRRSSRASRRSGASSTSGARASGAFDRVLRRLLGLEAKMRQYRDGAVFVRGVIEAVGIDGFNAHLGLARDAAAARRDRGTLGLGARVHG